MYYFSIASDMSLHPFLYKRDRTDKLKLAFANKNPKENASAQRYYCETMSLNLSYQKKKKKKKAQCMGNSIMT